MNLEKVLIKQNKKISAPEELLVLREYDKLGSLQKDDRDILIRIGLGDNITNGEKVKEITNSLMAETLKFDQSRVFHISQIESTCNKYYLKFLSASRFKGEIPNELPSKISNFEIATGRSCRKVDLYIMAPANSFKLEEKPKDPLLFYQINGEYYYLIHKWGNDLSFSRRLIPFFSGATPVSVLILFFMCLCLFLNLSSKGGNLFKAVTMGMFLGSTALFLWQSIAQYLDDDDTIKIFKKNTWNSFYND